MEEKNESILTSIKKLLGIADDYTIFDMDVIIFINTAFATLEDLGIGPSEGFRIKDSTTTWDEYITDWRKFEDVKTYIYLKVKLLFDPPQNSATATSYKEQMEETGWRLMIRKEVGGEES